MPVYNGEKFLQQAVDSILAQTFKEFEFIIIDDGSSDRSPEILETYRKHDSRIRVHRQPQNKGLVEALNTGCQLATGDYIARMDADDISLPERFTKQIQYLDANPQVGFVGTWIDYINEHDQLQPRQWCPPTSTKIIQWSLLFAPCLAHPTWMFRRSVGEKLGYYRSMTVEDYDFLVRASKITQISNVSEVLLHYRYWSQSKSTVNAKTEAPTTAVIMIDQLNVLFGETRLSVEDGLDLQRILSGRLGSASVEQVVKLSTVIQDAYNVFRTQTLMSSSELRNVSIDAAVKILTAAALIAKRSPLAGISLARKALGINSAASVAFVQKVVKNLRERRYSV